MMAQDHHATINSCVHGMPFAPRHRLVRLVACGYTPPCHARSGMRIDATCIFIFPTVGFNLLAQNNVGNPKVFEQSLQNGNFIQIFIFYIDLNEITNQIKKIQHR
jgi:hypothetical protein